MNMKQAAFAALCAALFLIPATVWAVTIKINDTRSNNYYLEALTWLLDKSGKAYTIVPTDYPVSSQARKVAFVKTGDIDILYAGTSIKLEQQLRPIRFPIMRGLIGRRVFIINKTLQAEYGLVKNIDDLKKHVGIQGLGWADTQILEFSGLKQAGALYDDIFTRINAGSRYYFPRGVVEAFSELADMKNQMPDLAVENNILLVYKAAVFFFVHPANTELAAMLETGFQKGYEDGSYDRFFYTHPLIKRSLAQANLQNRTVLKIPNPFLSPETNAVPARYWHRD